MFKKNADGNFEIVADNPSPAKPKDSGPGIQLPPGVKQVAPEHPGVTLDRALGRDWKEAEKKFVDELPEFQAAVAELSKNPECFPKVHYVFKADAADTPNSEPFTLPAKPVAKPHPKAAPVGSISPLAPPRPAQPHPIDDPGLIISWLAEIRADIKALKDGQLSGIEWLRKYNPEKAAELDNLDF
jgi:hypothetical protein